MTTRNQELIGQQTAYQTQVPDTTQQHPLGLCVYEHDDFFGSRELIYVKSAAAMVYGTPVTLAYTTATNGTAVVTATAMATSIANGTPVVATATKFTAADQFGWAVRAGFAPVASDSALAADAAVFAHAAGRIGATGVGKQLLGINVNQAATKTVVKTATTEKGSYIIRLPNGLSADGWFVGMPLTGTGIGSSAKITAINTDRTVTVDVVSTATGTVSVTGTYNDSTIYWSVCHLSYPHSVV